jgi:uncharacterized membrane protein HdeD (DUF308 family)
MNKMKGVVPMRYVYILLVIGFLLSGCCLGKEFWEGVGNTAKGIVQGSEILRQAQDDNFISNWWQFIGSVISLAAGTYLATRKIRLWLATELKRLSDKSEE